MVSQIKVIIKDEEKSLTKDFLEYETYTVDENDPILKAHIEETLMDFGSDPDDITVKINYKVQ